MKDANKQTVVLTEAILFDNQLILRITFDLMHINHGWDEVRHEYTNKKRSSYTAIDIIDFFEQFRYYKVEWLSGLNKEKVRIKGNFLYRYFWDTTDEEGIAVRIVLDIPENVTGEGIIVTVFKT